MECAQNGTSDLDSLYVSVLHPAEAWGRALPRTPLDLLVNGYPPPDAQIPIKYMTRIVVQFTETHLSLYHQMSIHTHTHTHTHTNTHGRKIGLGI